MDGSSRLRALSCVVLLGAPLGAPAQEAAGSPDLFSVTFAPGPLSQEAPAPGSNAPDDAGPAVAEDGEIDRLFEAIAGIERSIADEVALNGPQARALIDHYQSLAALYEELGDPFRARAAYEQASAVIRMNDGLHTLDQAESIGRTIEMLEAVEAFGESDELQDDLLDLAARSENESDLRVPSILAAVADRQMSAAQAYLDDDVWPRARQPLVASEGSGWDPSTPKAGRQRALTQLAVIADVYDSAIEAALAGDGAAIADLLDPPIGELYEIVDTANDFLEVGVLPRMVRRGGQSGPSWDAEPPRGDRDFATGAMYRARRLYSAAMQAARRQGSQAEYWALEERFVETYYFERTNPELGSDVVVDPHVPSPLESVLRARVADRLARGAPAIEVARALVELADALPNRESLERYQDAHDFLVRQDASAGVIAELFHPDVPVIRRAFGPEDLRPFDPARAYRGYIDVEVETGRYGQARSVEVLESSPGTSRAIEKSLRKRVSKTRFRPRFAGGGPVRSDRFAIRYVYDYDVLE